MTKEPHEVLGVSEDAKLDDVKKAYRKLVAKFHPDKGGSAKQFREITDAFNAMKSSWRLSEEPEFIDEDIEAVVCLTLEEMVFGCVKKVDVEIESVKCRACSGAGAVPGTPLMPCMSCLGTGKTKGIWGFSNTPRPCITCKGSGTVPVQACPRCRGKGKTKGEVEMKVNIPAGVEAGQTVSFFGGADNCLRGNFFIKIVGILHSRFKRCGDDLVTTVKIGVLDAIRGCTTSVVGLDGVDAEMSVPAGIQPGDRLTIPRHGVKNEQTGRTGDLIVEIQVEIPSKITARASRLMEELAYEFTRK
jgi:molecular chaperone DnaJ